MAEAAVPKPLLPVDLGGGRVRYARGVRAGDWVFATGLLAQDFQGGIAEEILRAPLTGAPVAEREATLLFDHLAAVLEAGGTGFDRLVRVDQYYPDAAAVVGYQRIRQRRLGGRIPASTSVLVQELLLPRAGIELHALAYAGAVPPVVTPGPTVTVGDFVFLGGQFAVAQGDEPARDGLAVAATVPPGTFWTGDPMRRELEFVIRHRIEPALARAGSSLRQVLKAQIYLTDAREIPVFNQVWAEAFGADVPATTIVAVEPDAIGLTKARLEINLVALHDGATIAKQVIRADGTGLYPGHPAAIRAGDLLFLSGLMANDANGLVPEARPDPRQPYFGCPAAAEAECILAKAERICRAAGTRLGRVVRIQEFHQDLGAFRASHDAWRRHLPDRALPFSAMRVSGPSPVAGAGLLMDLWVHAPVSRP